MNLVTFAQKSVAQKSAIACLSVLCLSALKVPAVQAATSTRLSAVAYSAGYAQASTQASAQASTQTSAQASTQASPADAGIALYEEGTVLERQGTPESLSAAVEKYIDAIAAFKSANLLPQEAITQHRLGHAYAKLESLKEAADTFKIALRLWQQIGDQENILELQEDVALSSLYLGMSFEEDNNEIAIAAAIIQYDMAIDLVTGDENRENRAWLWQQKGNAYLKLNNPEESVKAFSTALELWRAIGDAERSKMLLEMTAGTLYNWGLDVQKEGSPASIERALTLYDEALAMLADADIPNLRASILHVMGHAHEDLGNSSVAIEEYERSLAIWRSLNNSEQIAAIEDDLKRLR